MENLANNKSLEAVEEKLSIEIKKGKGDCESLAIKEVGWINRESKKFKPDFDIRKNKIG